jgi:hypothetical protein
MGVTPLHAVAAYGTTWAAKQVATHLLAASAAVDAKNGVRRLK